MLCVEWLVSVARRLMTVTAASNKRISVFSGGEDVILDDVGINKLNLTVTKQCYVVNCYMYVVEKTLY